MTIEPFIAGSGRLKNKELCAALISRFGVKQPVNWDSVLPPSEQQSLFGGEILRLVCDHPILATQKEIRPICLMKGDVSQLLFFFVQLKDEKLSKPVIEKITKRFIGGAAADRYIIWFFANKSSNVLKIVISGKEGRKIRLKTLSLEAGQWFKTYEYIFAEIERMFKVDFKEPSALWNAVWSAFDISIVNKKFYAEIKNVFDALVNEELPKCKGVLTSGQERVQFAIRLIGRIIFCWFLKKKGIISNDVLSSTAVKEQPGYYRYILEPLFFDVFNTPVEERRTGLPDSIRDYPFLNGGLFEPQYHDYKGNWALVVSDDWFINFFGNTLERYNFTIDENSAANSEIAIDPEMLGRIFENLLAEQNPETGKSARKSTGSYYTPREIVDFMVEQSLIAYLKASMKTIPGMADKAVEAVEEFVHTESLPDSLKSQSRELLDKLDTVKVLDPACGSGAFPIGMLQKLAGLKRQLDQKASAYSLKLKTVENSIYGVDIQPMATELSRLRCWLSLIVDENPDDIKPLPNLDFKFVTADSLVDIGYEEFFNKRETTRKNGGLLFLADFRKSFYGLEEVRKKFFEPSLDQKDKDTLKEEFKAIKTKLFNMSLELIKRKYLDVEFANKMNGWDPFDDSKPAPFFNKSWMFGVEDGFDVVIANPPYIRHEAIMSMKPQMKERFGAFYCGTADMYTYFYKAGIDFLKPSGHLCFIAPNKFMRAGYGKNTRTLLTSEATPKVVIDFCDLPLFDATTYPAVLLLEKRRPEANDTTLAATFTTKEQLARVDETMETIGFPMPALALKAEGWNLEKPEVRVLMDKLRNAGIPLAEYVEGKIYYGIKTGLNEAFVIDAATREKLIAEDPNSEELIKPWLRGRDIKKWKAQWAGLYVIAISSSANKHWVWSDETSKTNAKKLFHQAYPAIHNHLSQWEDRLQKRDDQGKFWWELRSCAYYEEFERPKIIYPNITKTNIFAFDTTGILTNQKCFIIPANDPFLLAILNSKLAMQWFAATLPLLRGGFFEPSAIFMQHFPVFPASDSQRNIMLEHTNSILANPDSPDVPRLEAGMNKLVYALYGLTPQEIAIIEGGL